MMYNSITSILAMLEKNPDRSTLNGMLNCLEALFNEKRISEKQFRDVKALLEGRLEDVK